MHIYLVNNSTKFHPDPTWNDAALAFLNRVTPTGNNNNQQYDERRYWSKKFYRHCEIMRKQNINMYVRRAYQ